jgi:hypothetical protein
VARPKTETVTLSRERASSTSSTTPLKDAKGPSETLTCSPTSKETDGFGRMPFVFAYMITLYVWIFVTCTIWCAACLMCVVQRTGRFAWPPSLAIATTFPFVFAYQIMAQPVIFAMLLEIAAGDFALAAGYRLTTSSFVAGTLNSSAAFSIAARSSGASTIPSHRAFLAIL